MQRPLTVHPHVRGVYKTIENMTWKDSGSSPRAWGLCRRSIKPCGNVRFIPTCVGFMLPCCSQCRRSTVHPHVRGVYVLMLPDKAYLCGSSPRAWGLCHPAQSSACHFRFIPTCVGFIISAFTLAALASVHPHVRGVYIRPCENGEGAVRFIPTCVGFISTRCKGGSQ